MIIKEAYAHMIQLGAVGCMAVMMAWFLVKLYRDHRKERDEWRESNARQMDAYVRAIERNTSTLDSVKEGIVRIEDKTKDCHRK